MDENIFNGTVVLLGGGSLVAAMIFYGLRRDKAAHQRSQQFSETQIAKAAPLLATLAEGRLPVMAADKLLAKKGEVTHFAASADLLEIQTTHYEGGGAAVRIGRSLTVGGGRKRAVKGLVAVSGGELCFTSQRIVFSGIVKSFECKLENLTHVESLSDGFIFHRGNKAHKIQITDTTVIQVGRATLALLLNR